jgi:hypothetical protein
VPGEDHGAVRALDLGQAADAASARRVVRAGGGRVGAAREVVGAAQARGVGGEGGDDQVAGADLVGADDPKGRAGEEVSGGPVGGGGGDDERVEDDVQGVRGAASLVVDGCPGVGRGSWWWFSR